MKKKKKKKKKNKYNSIQTILSTNSKYNEIRKQNILRNRYVEVKQLIPK